MIETPRATASTERTHAVLTRFGANALRVQAWPRARIAEVGQQLVASGVPASPLSVDELGVAAALLIFYPDDFGPEVTEQCVSVLLQQGTSAYGYELLHEHGIVDVDLFQRVGCVPEASPQAPVFIQATAQDDDWNTVHAVLLGDELALRRAVSIVGSTEHCDLAEGPSGLESAVISFDSDAQPRAQKLLRVLEENGVDVHFQAFKNTSPTSE